MSEAMHELLRKNIVAANHSLAEIQGDSPMNGPVLEGREHRRCLE